MRTLKKTAKRLVKLGSQEGILEMKLPYVALGDLRRRWSQKERPLHPALLRKLKNFT